MVVFGNYDTIDAARKRLNEQLDGKSVVLPAGSITTGKYKNSNEGKFISLLDFKVLYNELWNDR